jgi:hypothetical protein
VSGGIQQMHTLTFKRGEQSITKQYNCEETCALGIQKSSSTVLLPEIKF